MKITTFVICMFFTLTCICQRVSMGIGFGINQTRLRQTAPTINVDFSNPHKPGIGISTSAVLSITIGKHYSASFKPGISILTTHSNVTNDQLFGFLNLTAEVGYVIKSKASINFGLQHSYLIRWLSKFKGPYKNWTFFANNRHFVHPVANIDYQINEDWSTQIKFEYYLQDVFNSGALDNDGNIVGPVMVYPYTIGIGCTYKIKHKSLKTK